MSVIKKTAGKTIDLLKNLPRVTLANLQPNPGAKKEDRRRGRGQHGGNRSGRGHKGERQRGNRPRLGFEGGQTPFYLIIPKYGYNADHSRRPQFPPLSLRRLQYLIDLGRVDPSQPIDLTQLVNGRGVTIQPLKRDHGVQLTDEGADVFRATVNLEVQAASQSAIAAVERNGGVISTSYYDPRSLRQYPNICSVRKSRRSGGSRSDWLLLQVLIKPVPFLMSGEPIPKRLLPGEDLLPYYTDPSNRGYLADPEQVQAARRRLAEKYGYRLPDLSTLDLCEMLRQRKDPRQIFFGLSPGWIVNMADKKILKPTDDKLLQYYSS